MYGGEVKKLNSPNNNNNTHATRTHYIDLPTDIIYGVRNGCTCISERCMQEWNDPIGISIKSVFFLSLHFIGFLFIAQLK